MPEMPDVTVYAERLARRVVGKRLHRIKVLNPFLVRTAVPPLAVAEGKRVEGVERLAKRIVLALEGELFLVIHLMIAGRLKWLAPGSKPPGRIALALFEFETAGTLLLTEAGTQRRASIHLLQGRDALAAMDPGGIDVMTADLAGFRGAAGGREPHRSSAPSPCRSSSAASATPIPTRSCTGRGCRRWRLTRSLDAGAVERLYDAARAVLAEWTERLGAEADRAGGWPEKVTAFHPQMAVHGRFGQPCPDCGAPVQRIVRADNETNYCARCQTGGKLLADRALSRLLKESWPKNIDELG